MYQVDFDSSITTEERDFQRKKQQQANLRQLAFMLGDAKSSFSENNISVELFLFRSDMSVRQKKIKI